MKIGDMVRPVPLNNTRTTAPDSWTSRVGIIVGFEEERDYAGIPVTHMPIVYWGSDFVAEVEYREQIEVISVALPRNKSNIVARG
jgi:hypothetical protein